MKYRWSLRFRVVKVSHLICINACMKTPHYTKVLTSGSMETGLHIAHYLHLRPPYAVFRVPPLGILLNILFHDKFVHDVSTINVSFYV